MRTSRSQSADPARAGMECRRGSNEAREPFKAAARRAEHEMAGRYQPRDRREGQKYPFENAFRRRAQTRRAQTRRARLILGVCRQKIGRLFDKARLRSPPAAKQKNIGAARLLQREAKPVHLVFGLDQGAARVIG